MRLATRISKARVRPAQLRPARGLAMPPAATDTFGTSTDLRQRVLIALEPDYSLPYWQWGWTDITEYVRWDPGIDVTYGRQDETGLVSTLSASMELENDGRFSRRNPFGAYAGKLTRNTPVWASVNPGGGWHDRLFGYVNSWPKRWDSTGTDSTVPIGISGVMRRLQQAEVLKSTMNRSMAGVAAGDFVPVAYWPFEDGANATSFAAATSGTSPAVFTGDVVPAAYTDAIGSNALPTVGAGSTITATIPAYTDTGVWQHQFFMAIPSAPLADADFLNIYVTPGSGSTLARLRVYFDVGTGFVNIRSYDISGAVLSTSGFAPIYDTPLLWAVTEYQQSAGVFLAVLSMFETGFPTSQATVGDVGAVGRALEVVASATGDNTGWATGHWAFYTNPALVGTPSIGPNATAMGGHVGETGPERMARLCREEQVPFFCGDSSNVTLGPQPSGTLIEVLRDTEKADGGVLYEYQFGFGYKPLSSFYNQPVHLPLNQAAGQLAGSVEADDSDQTYINQWTATRTDGSSSTWRDPDYRSADGLFAGEDTYNVETDSLLPDISGWQVALGTVDEDRWPRIEIDLTNHPELIPYWVNLPFGGRTQVSSPHEEVGVDEIDAIVQGWTEHWNSKLWSAAMNTTPASVYDIPLYDDGVEYGARTSVLAAAISSSDTSVSVYSGTDTWMTTASHPSRFAGFSVEIGGIDYPCSAITGTAPNYTFTISRLGTDREHAVGVPVRASETSRYGR